MTPLAMDDQMELPIAVLLKSVVGEGPLSGRGQSLGGRLAVGDSAVYGRVRPTSLPEHTPYRDDGCEVNPSCFTCPLPRCRYEEPGGLRGVVKDRRDRRILKMRSTGAKVERSRTASAFRAGPCSAS